MGTLSNVLKRLRSDAIQSMAVFPRLNSGHCRKTKMVKLVWWLFVVSASCGFGQCTPTDGAVKVTQVTQPVLHAEGPMWDAERGVLWFVDINGKHINQYQPSTGKHTSISVDGLVTFVIPIKGTSLLSVGIDRNLVYVDWSGDENVTRVREHLVATVDTEPGLETNRFNDAKADVFGRLWAGTMGYEDMGVVEKGRGSLYRFDHDSIGVKQLSNVSISNGLVWSTDNTVMYYIDSDTRRVDAFDFDLRQGAISHRRPVFHLDEYNLPGVPDGMTIDADGNLWVALYGGHHVINVDPQTGNLLRQIELPARDVSSVTFGGPSLETLYVTTSRKDLDEEQSANQPAAGAVFAIDGLGVRGIPAGNNKVGQGIMDNCQDE